MVLKQTQNESFDLVLVYSAFQRNCIYTQLVKYLPKSFKIGIYLSDNIFTKDKVKNDTNRQLIKLLNSFGASIINSDKVETKILIISQSNFSKIFIDKLKKQVNTKKTFWLVGLAMGNAFHRNLYGMTIDKILVPDLNLYKYRIRKFERNKFKVENAKLHEIGINYSKYPVIKKTKKIDFIIAGPTPYSFNSRIDVYDFLKNLNFYIKYKISKNDIITYKQHNAELHNDFIIKQIYVYLYLIFKLFFFIKKIKFFLENYNLNSNNSLLSKFIIEILIVHQYKLLKKRAPLFKKFTFYSNLNLEIFLPFIKKGIITGRSNSIWHGLFHKKIVINCVDKNKPYFPGLRMHKWTMSYFDVHGNYKKKFNSKKYKIINDTTRDADFVNFIKSELNLL